MLGRSIFSHHLWREDRVFSRVEAWLDLLQTAAIAPQKRLIAGHVIEIPRGGIVAAVRFLSVRYKWSNTKVCLFLDSLECEGMITREKRHGNTVILLCNFEKYNTKKRQKSDKETTPGRRRDDEVEEGKEANTRSPSTREESRQPPTMEAVLSYANTAGIAKECAQKWFHSAESRPFAPSGMWTNPDETEMGKWPSSLQGYWISWQRNTSAPRQRESAPTTKRTSKFSQSLNPDSQ